MNLFQKYGIKEVADVVFYSIIRIEEEEFYIPVLYLDTLKISTLDKTTEEVIANGGKTNRKLIGWNFGKNITLKLEDALFTPASMSLIWSGNLKAKLTLYIETIIKCNIANKYGKMNYSIKAKPSPTLSLDSWELIFDRAQVLSGYDPNSNDKIEKKNNYKKYKYDYNEQTHEKTDENNEFVAENRRRIIHRYYQRNNSLLDPPQDMENRIKTVISQEIENRNETAIPQKILDSIAKEIKKLSDIGYIDTDIDCPQYIDRMEKCVVTDKDGFIIDAKQQHDNIISFYNKEFDHSYTIYYDPKTMLPLFHLNDEDGNFDYLNEDEETSKTFTLKYGTVYYKWTRTTQSQDSNTTIGRSMIIDTNTFPGEYRIVGETYVREYKTGKDQRYQFTINCAKLKTDSTIELQADGDPTVFSMEVEVFNRYNKDMVQLCQYDVEEDILEGGFRILPQKSKYTYTSTNIEFQNIDISNEEIY